MIYQGTVRKIHPPTLVPIGFFIFCYLLPSASNEFNSIGHYNAIRIHVLVTDVTSTRLGSYYRFLHSKRRHSIQNRKTRGGTRVTDDGQHVLTRFLCVTLCCTWTLSYARIHEVTISCAIDCLRR